MMASVAHHGRVSIAHRPRSGGLGLKPSSAGVSLQVVRSEPCVQLCHAQQSIHLPDLSQWQGTQGSGVAQEYDPSSTCRSSSTQPLDASQHGPVRAGLMAHMRMAVAYQQAVWRRLANALHRLQNVRLEGSNQLLAMGLAFPVISGNPVQQMLTNVVLMTGFWAWFLAQFAKIFTKRFKKGVWDIKAVIEPGGMPSSHSSLCSGVTTAIALQYGFGSPLFAVGLAFSVIVMYDAMGVRRHAGKQAEVLNQVINELMDDHPIVGEIKLKEVLGHTPRQVICGALLGVLVGLLYPSVQPLVVA